MIICIDPGHGGSNYGTRLLKTMPEKSFNLLIALRLRNLLMQKGHTIVMTRDTDVNVSKAERAGVSRNSDIVISLHVNAHPLATNLCGLETFNWSGNPKGQQLAQLILKYAPHELQRLKKPHAVESNLFWSQGAYSILTTHKSTTILIEIGYASNKKDRKYLLNEANQDKIAVNIGKAVQQFKQRNKMDSKELAKELDGCEYRKEMTKEQEKLAKKNGLIVAFGASDDSIELHGAIEDEESCYFEAKIPLTKDGFLINKCNDENCYYHHKLRRETEKIKITWQPHCQITIDIPYNKFHIWDNGRIYCEGIVFSINDL